MLRLLLAFLILFAGATALIALLPKPPAHQAPASNVAVALRNEADPQSERAVRIVYPPTAVSSPTSPTPSAGSAPDQAVVAPADKPAVAPSLDPQKVAGAGPQGGGAPQADAILQAAAKVDLNTASVDELDQIPGGGRIGRAITSRRPYRSVEDLLTKRVVRKSIYERIKDEVAAN